MRQEQVRNPPQPAQQLIECRVRFLMRHKPSMKSNEFEAKVPGQTRRSLDVFPILVPGRIGGDSSGSADRFQGTVILCHATKHARGYRNVMLLKKRGGLTQNFRGPSKRIQRELS